MAKRKPVETDHVDQAAHDAETVRLLKEAVKKSASDAWYIHKHDILDILTRKPAAKKGKKHG